MFSVGSDFSRGIGYVFKGVMGFWKRPRLWVYAIVPFICVKALFAVVSYYVMNSHVKPLVERLTAVISGWGMETLAVAAGFIVHWTAVIAFFLFMASITSMLFEMFGGVFFTYMVRRYEHIVYERPLDPPVTWRQDLLNTVGCVVYSAGTVILNIPLLLLGFVFPFVAHALAACFVGYRYGISYCAESGFNKGWSIALLQQRFAGRKAVLYGFGMMVFLLLMIPYVSIFLIPGFVIGGTILVNEEHRRA